MFSTFHDISGLPPPQIMAYESYVDVELAILIPFVLASITIILRLYVRLRARTQGTEDWLILAASVCNVALIGLVEATEVSYAQTDPYETEENPGPSHDESIRKEIPSFILSLVVPLLAKMSVVFLLARLSGMTSRWRRRFLFWSITVFALLTLVCSVLGVAGLCLYLTDDVTLNIFIQHSYYMVISWTCIGAILDLAYSGVALHMIRATQLTAKRKVGVGVLFSLGCVTAGVTAVRAEKAYGFGFSTNFRITPWVYIEGSAIIFCANLPMLLPLWEYLRHGRSLQPERPTPPSVQTRQRKPKLRRLTGLSSLLASDNRMEVRGLDQESQVAVKDSDFCIQGRQPSVEDTHAEPVELVQRQYV